MILIIVYLTVAHKIYGIPQTINTANYVYFLAFQELFPLCRSSGDGEIQRPINYQDLDHIVTGELPVGVGPITDDFPRVFVPVKVKCST
jgi:hypothetical protein